MPFTYTFLKNLKHPVNLKKYKNFDGLYLYSAPTSLKSWRFHYRFYGELQTLTFGTYPLVSIKEARDKLVEAKRSPKAGLNPALEKKRLNEAEKMKRRRIHIVPLAKQVLDKINKLRLTTIY
ncbi:MAG: integrase family protein [Deltaproteobacteria bacterium]|jgi:hypothetical protein|nr:integrase family protein [Deltaproteobacteria bacterium]